MAVAAADIAPKAFQTLVAEGGENQDVEEDLQVSEYLTLAEYLTVILFSVCGLSCVKGLVLPIAQVLATTVTVCNVRERFDGAV